MRIQTLVYCDAGTWDFEAFLKEVKKQVETLPLNAETMNLHRLFEAPAYEDHIHPKIEPLNEALTVSELEDKKEAS